MSIFKPYKRIYLKLDDTLSHGVLYTHIGSLNAKDMVTFNEVLLNNGQKNSQSNKMEGRMDLEQHIKEKKEQR